MRRVVLGKTPIHVLSLGLALLSPWSEAAEQKGFTDRLTWSAEETGRTAEGLGVYVLETARAVHTLFLLTPGGRGIILTSVLDARAGTHTATLRDDNSGWQIELRYKTGFTAATLQEFFHASHELSTPDQLPFIDVVVSVPGTTRLAAQVRNVHGELDLDQLASELRSRAPGLWGSVPEGIKNDLPLLAQLLPRTSEKAALLYSLRKNVDLLVRLGKIGAPPPKPNWTFSPAPARYFTGAPTVSDPESLRLLSRFKTPLQSQLVEQGARTE